MVLLIGIHVSRTYLMAAYKFPRELNWLTGAVLLLLTLALAFTGQLLRWDQNAVWSVIVGAAQAGRMPVVGRRPGALHPGGRHHRRRHAEPVLRLPRLLHPGARVRLHRPAPGAGAAARHLGAARGRRRGGSRHLPRALRRAAPAGRRALLARRRLAGRGLRRGDGRDRSCSSRWSSGPPELGKPPDPSILEAYPRPDWYFLWYFAVLALAPQHLETLHHRARAAHLRRGRCCCCRSSTRGPAACGGAPGRRCWSCSCGPRSERFWVAGERADWSPDFTARPLPASVVRQRRPRRSRRARGCSTTRAASSATRSGSYGGKRGPELTEVAAG